MIVQMLHKVISGQDLSIQESERVMKEIMTGQATPAQIAGFLIALKLKGESVHEVVGCARVMRQLVAKPRRVLSNLIDTCGTGGDGVGSFNISTVSALVVAGAGGRVAKHGNRAISSRCGSADLLKELGVRIDASSKVVQRCIKEVGVGFLFAPQFHSSMKHAAVPRRELGVRTLFNLLGPLTNPFGASRQLVGVYEKRLLKLFAQALKRLGSKHVLVCYGEDGLDEVTTTGKTWMMEVKKRTIRSFVIIPERYGIKRVHVRALMGGSIHQNAQITLNVLKGKQGPHRDIVLLNAACALYAGDRVVSIRQGLRMAKEAIDSGACMKTLKCLQKISQGG
jgi:anthranilate phosphoribosyltransferase